MSAYSVKGAPRRAPPSRPTTALSTRTDATTGNSHPGEWILSILPARGQGTRQVGIVALEKDSARVTVTNLAGDSPTWVKSVHLARTKPPCVILLPSTALLASLPIRKSLSEQDIDSLAGEEEESTVSAAGDPQVAMLVKALQAAFPDATFVPVMRKYWNESDGYEYLTRLIVPSEDRLGILTACRNQYYSLSAASALFHWLEHAQGLAFAPRSLRIDYEAPDGTCLIDAESAANLELVSNVLDKNSKQHLLGMLNHCFTPMGTRALRTNVLSPLTDRGKLDARLDAVEELVNSEERFRAIRKALEPLKGLDLDRLTSRLLAPPRRTTSRAGSSSLTRLAFFSQLGHAASNDPSLLVANYLASLLALRTFLNSLPALRASVTPSSSAGGATLLTSIARALQDEQLDEIGEVVRENMNEEVWAAIGKGNKGKASGEGTMVTKHQRLFAIKAERKRLLDVARETYRENMSDINDLADAFRTRHALESLDHKQGEGMKGAAFFLRMSKDEWEEKKRELAKGGAINVVTKRNKVEFSTLDLMKLNARLAASEEEILLMSRDVLEEILDGIRDKIACLYRCSEAIALLDMLASFAEVATKNADYVRPEWTDTLAIKQGRHPLHEQFRTSDGSFVPNDTYANDATSFQIINGPNMSGKSTLLRQIALLHVMAQIGCFVPALYASFRPVSAILTRLSNDDNLEASLSTFASEMATMSFILGALKAHEDNKCLVIVDELGRGTSPDEGVGIAHAIAEEIIKAKAFCFFATHFKELSITLPGRFPNVVALHLETDIDRGKSDFSLTFKHRLRDGSTPLTHYGLELAKIVKLPAAMYERAELVSLTLASLAEEGKARAGETKLVQRRRALLELRAVLRDAAATAITDASKLRTILRELQQKTIGVLADTIDAESVRARSRSTATPAEMPPEVVPALLEADEPMQADPEAEQDAELLAQHADTATVEQAAEPVAASELAVQHDEEVDGALGIGDADDDDMLEYDD